MANTIRHKRGTTTPLASNLVTGEIAINTSTGAAFTKTDAGSVVQIGGSGGGTWGSITGTLSSQTDLNTALGLKSPLASPTFTGTPAAPTATAGTSTTQLATTAFVTTADNLKANLASPTFTGVPAAPLAATGTDTTQLATTSFVQQELAAGTAVAKSVVATVRNETGATLTKGTVVYISGAGGNKALVSKAQADTEANSSGTYGLVQTDIANNNNGTVVIAGIITGLDTDAYADGDKIYLSPTVAGGWTTTKPSAPDHMVFLGTITHAHANQGAIQLRISNGFELEELHNVSIPSTPTDGYVLTYNSSTGLWGAEAPSGGGGGAAAIPAYDNGVTYTVGQQVIFSNRFWYMSTSVGGAGYDPIGYPSYWTEISAGGGSGGLSINDLANGATSTLNTTQPETGYALTFDGTDLVWANVTASHLPLSGGTMTGAINFGTGGQNIDVGTFDSGRYGSNGISLKCAVGFELNWQAGWLTGNQFLGTPSIVPIYIDSGAGSTLKVWEGTTSTGVTISHTGITFPDSTTQTTAGIADAPSDGSNYGRLNGAWAATLPDAPSDGTQYVRQNGSWQVNSGFTHSDSPNDGNMYARAGSSLGWVQIGTGTDAIATQNYVTSQGYATTGDVSTAVSGLVTASNARKQALVEAFRAALDDSGKTYDFSGYLNYPFKSGAFNTCVTNGEFSSTGKWFGIMEPVASSFISPATFVQLSGSVVTISFAYANGATGTGLYYTEDGGTTWVESTFKI